MAEAGFWRLAEAEPSRVVLIDPDGTPVTGGELLAACNQLVHGLRALGLATGSVVAVATRNRAAFLETYLAAMQAGWYFVPLDYHLAPPEVAYVLADSGARAVVFDQGSADAVGQAVDATGLARERCLAVDPMPGWTHFDALKRSQPVSEPAARLAGARLSYTSGTTGRPRAVHRALDPVPPEQQAAMAAGHLWLAARIRPDRRAVHLVSSPLYHSAALLWCADHLHAGHSVVLMDKWTAEGALERVERHGVTTAFMVPTHFRRLLALPDSVKARYRSSTLQHVVHSGAPCPVELKRAMLEWLGPVLYETYAGTEGPATQVGPQEWLAHPGTVGRAGTRVRVLRDDGSPCPAGEVGAVWIDLGAQPFEYLRDPHKTAAARRGNYFTMGDLGYVDEQGYLFLCDRSDDVIISGGVNIYPAEIESVLVMHRVVADAAVIGIPDDEWGEKVMAVVQPAEGVEPGPALAAELQAFCRARLAPAKCPRLLEFVDAVPRDPNGKLYRRRLRDPHWAGRGRAI